MTEQASVRLSHAPTAVQTYTRVPFRLGVYGEGGVGKTTLAASFPKPLFINTDQGLEGDVVAQDLVAEEWLPENWRDLNALYFWLKAKIEERGYETIVIDSIDTLARFILHEAHDMATRGREANASLTTLVTPEQQDYGKVANALDIFLGNLKALQAKTGVHIVLTSGVREQDPDKGRLKRTFDVQPAVESVILYWANIYGELVNVETKVKEGENKGEIVEERILWTRASDPTRRCKTRFGILRPGVKNPTFAKMAGLVDEAAAAQQEGK